MECHWPIILLLVVSVASVNHIGEAKECKFPAIFNFGDSNSDTGGLSAAFGQAGPPHGETFFHSPAGRYCDGRLVVDFIGGVFKDLLPKGEYFSKGLYTFDIGQNDLVAGYFLNMSTDQVRAFVPDLITQFSTIVKDIHDQGGRYFWIHNTGPVGCLPYVMDRLLIKASEVDKVGCAGPFNEVAQYFNRKLKEEVAHLRKELPHAVLTYVDVYSVKYDLIANASLYGFEHPLRACCGHGGRYNYNEHIGCGGKIIVKGKEVLVGKACKNPYTAINWDGVHYTEAANKWIFNRIVDGSYSDPPIPLKKACMA